MILEKYTTGRFRTNSYIIGDENTRNVAMIDAGDGIEEILALIKEKYYNVKYILITHGHFDHVLGAGKARDFTGAQVVMNQADQELAGVLKPDIFVLDGDEISFDGFKIKVMTTPGHTPGGVCYKYSNLLFSGDTLFYKNVGRWDLMGGDRDALLKSVCEKLLMLPDDVKVFPGHGEGTTIGFERENNPYINLK